MNLAASPVGQIRLFSWTSFPNKSQLTHDSSLFVAMAILETSRLTLRPFREDDVDLLSDLMANQDFMRFSLGPYSNEQTQTVLEKFLWWNRAGRPSQSAVVLRSNSTLIGYSGFLHWHLDGVDEIEIGYSCIQITGTKGLRLKPRSECGITLFGI
jgi:RimJ/RimL family protein N-acetyltransferase